MFFTGATVPGSSDVPNEDWVATTSDLIVVLDGATVRTETGCRHGAAWYTRKLGAAIIARVGRRSISLTGALGNAIHDVRALHVGDCDLTNPGTPSAAVGIVWLDGDRVRYLVLGDTTIVLDGERGVGAVSDQRISKSAAGERAEVDRHLIGTREKSAALVVMKHAELAARNTEGGYWISAADPTIVDHAITGELPLSEVRRLAVFTDGAARYVDAFGLADWPTALSTLARTGPRWFIDKLVRPVEAADPLGARYPRNKRSDDATVVFAQLVTVEDTADFWRDLKPQSQLDADDELLRRLDDPRNYGDGTIQHVVTGRCSGNVRSVPGDV